MHKWIDSLSCFLSFIYFLHIPRTCRPPFLPLIETYPGIVCPSNFQGWLQHFPCLCCAFRLLVQHSVQHPFAKTSQIFSHGNFLPGINTLLWIRMDPQSFVIHQIWVYWDKCMIYLLFLMELTISFMFLFLISLFAMLFYELSLSYCPDIMRFQTGLFWPETESVAVLHIECFFPREQETKFYTAYIHDQFYS